MSSVDHRKASLNRVDYLYGNIEDQLNLIMEVHDEKLGIDEASEIWGFINSIESNLKYLYKFAKLGAMANASSYEETYSKLEKEMLEERRES